jgi:hypothetical protein
MRILSPRRIDRDHLEIGAVSQTVANLQAGRTDFTVDEYFGCHESVPS